MKLDLETTFRVLKLPKGEREHRFHDTRRWRFDYAWPKYKIALEYEGGVYQGGRHNRATGFEKDCEKYSHAAILGWKVIRVTSGMVSNGTAMELLELAFAGKRTK